MLYKVLISSASSEKLAIPFSDSAAGHGNFLRARARYHVLLHFIKMCPVATDRPPPLLYFKTATSMSVTSTTCLQYYLPSCYASFLSSFVFASLSIPSFDPRSVSSKRTRSRKARVDGQTVPSSARKQMSPARTKRSF